LEIDAMVGLRLELCRCPARAVEAACGALPRLQALSALAIRDAALDPAPLARLPRLRELRLKSMAGLALARDLAPLASLTHLTHLSLTSIKVTLSISSPSRFGLSFLSFMTDYLGRIVSVTLSGSNLADTKIV
jgi:hypothetical protein